MDETGHRARRANSGPTRPGRFVALVTMMCQANVLSLEFLSVWGTVAGAEKNLALIGRDSISQFHRAVPRVALMVELHEWDIPLREYLQWFRTSRGL